MNTVTLICGLPNAGKTTYSKKYSNVIHLDDIFATRLYDKFEKCTEIAAKSTTDVCIDGNYCMKKSRENLIRAFDGWKKVCIWLNTPLETCLERAKNGGRPENTVMAIDKLFEDPTKDEGWDELIVVNNE